MPCRVPYCTGPTSRFGTHCYTHRARQRRHGHPLQRAVTKAELAHYVAFVRKRKARNPASPFWKVVEGRWAGLVEHARGVTGEFYSGRPMIRHEVQACDAVVKIAENVEPDVVVETALAMYVMLEMDPRRFLSDDAFRWQLVRRLRGLTEVNAGEWYDHKTGKTKRAYRDLSPRTTAIMARLLVQTFGAPGVMLAKKEAEDLAKGKQHIEEMGEAVRAMQ
jgi:hypothetical protein